MNISRQLIKLARYLYRETPFLFLRRLYFNAFCYLVRDKKIQATVEGMTFDLDLGEIIDLAIYLQQFEPDVVAAIERYCQPGWTVLDIGANIGAHTLRFAKSVGPTGRVFAFEPTDYAYHKLVKNISLNDFKNILSFQIALSDNNLDNQKINFRSSWRTDKKRLETTSRVNFERLDSWCLRNQVHQVNLIKLDVDGNEFPIINGGREIIEQYKPLIFMEAVGPHFDDQEKNPFILLEKLQYRFWDAKSGQKFAGVEAMKALLPANDIEMTISFNVIAAIAPPAPIFPKEKR
jgi:FkbM family methyltransferase